MVRTFTGFGAPLLGGFVVALAGPTVGFVVNAVSFLGSIVAVLLVPSARVVRPPHDETSFVAQLRDGFGAVRERDWLWSGLVGAGLYHLGNGALLVLTPLIAVNQLGGSAAYGAIVAAEGLGGFVGAWLATRHRVRRPLLAGWLVLQTMPLWALSFAWPRDTTRSVSRPRRTFVTCAVPKRCSTRATADRIFRASVAGSGTGSSSPRQ